MRVTNKKQVNVTRTYHVSNNIKADFLFTNGKFKSTALRYYGKEHYGYGLTPVYKFDRNLLLTTNPFWGHGDYKELDTKYTEDDIKASTNADYTLAQSASHMFFDENLKPLPCVIHADYVSNGMLSDKYYDLHKLREYLQSHPNVVSVSERIDMPYYNSDCGNYYLRLKYVAEGDWQQEMLEKGQLKDYITGRPYAPEPDFLKIHQFCHNTEV